MRKARALGLALLATAAAALAADNWSIPRRDGMERQQVIAGGELPDGGRAPVQLDSAGNVKTVVATPTCLAIIVRASSCGTTSAAVPVSRTAGSTGLEITNSPENAGSPKVKCIADPSDGGVGFGGTEPGLVRTPGQSMYFGLDSTHTVICICDTPATAVTTTECVSP